jgi:signal transduction histidine kinase
MKNVVAWSKWNIAAKILVPFLILSIAVMAIMAWVAIDSLRTLENHALETSTSLGQSAINDSTKTLTMLGENTIKQISRDVAKQVELYLDDHPLLSLTDMRNDAGLREIAIQPVGTTGYTTLLDPIHSLIVVHKFQAQEKDINYLKDVLPSFWEMLQASASGPSSGYYFWQEVDGSITQKYASIVPINSNSNITLTLWATTYIEEFSRPALNLEKDINEAISRSSTYIRSYVKETQNAFIIVFSILIIVVIILSLLISRFITNPIRSLQSSAEEIGQGNLDHELHISNQDELGKLAVAFDKMRMDLKKSMAELRHSADQNIAKEKEIQDNLRLYAQKVTQAQETERKRISRDLHDETLQTLIVLARQLDDLTDNSPGITPEEIRQKVQKLIEEVHHFSQELRPSLLDDLGLVPALKSLCADLSKNSGINVAFKVKGSPVHLEPELEVTLYRIVQEALSNVRKHSQATKADVNLLSEIGRVVLTIQDNGIGFKVPSNYEGLTQRGKLGLIGMQERAQLLGGIITVESEPGKGTRLSITVPLVQQ